MGLNLEEWKKRNERNKKLAGGNEMEIETERERCDNGGGFKDNLEHSIGVR